MRQNAVIRGGFSLVVGVCLVVLTPLAVAQIDAEEAEFQLQRTVRRALAEMRVEVRSHTDNLVHDIKLARRRAAAGQLSVAKMELLFGEFTAYQSGVRTAWRSAFQKGISGASSLLGQLDDDALLGVYPPSFMSGGLGALDELRVGGKRIATKAKERVEQQLPSFFEVSRDASGMLITLRLELPVPDAEIDRSVFSSGTVGFLRELPFVDTALAVTQLSSLDKLAARRVFVSGTIEAIEGLPPTEIVLLLQSETQQVLPEGDRFTALFGASEPELKPGNSFILAAKTFPSDSIHRLTLGIY